ncbi:MAG: hypothetical protein JNM93_07655 [Bacteriovoracaceae bacterium]|nr:hypothetical protein [Bacteriovoracaceae bacterium]
MINYLKYLTQKTLEYRANQNGVTFLLGAGASAGLFPNVAQVTKLLLNWKGVLEPPSDLSLEPISYMLGGSRKGEILNESLRPYFLSIYETCKDRYDNPESFLHFERLINIAALLESTTTENFKAVDEYKKNLSSFIEYKKENERFNRKFINGMAANAATKYILNHFTKLLDTDLEKRLKECSLNNFLNDISSKKVLNIFSLNYDTQPLFSNIDFRTGFKTFCNESFEYFSSQEMERSYSDHMFCQLHGSILFSYPPANFRDLDEEKFPGSFARYKNPHDCIATRTESGNSSELPDGGARISTLMITGLRKADDILDEPFASYFRAFYEKLISCNKWVIVGYGSSDVHVNKIIYRAFKYWKEKNIKVKVVWVGYAPNDCFEDGVGYFEPGYELCDYSWDYLMNVFPNDIKEKFMGRKRAKIHRDKLNYFSSKYIDCTLSFKGTEDTFREHLQELSMFLIDS